MKTVNPDDTQEQQEAPRHVRRSSGPRRRVTLTADAVRDALEKRFRGENKWEDLVDLYLGRIEVVDRPEKVELFKRLAEVLWHELGDAEEAQDALVEALSLDPGDDEVADHLEDIAISRDHGWPKLIDAVAAKIESVEGSPAKATLAERVVRWARGEMNDKATAERFLAAIRTFDPAHPLVHERLASVYAEVGAWDSQREALERALARAQKDDDRCAMHVSLGELHEQRIPNPKLAAEHYEKAIGIEPRQVRALAGLERIYRATEQYARLAEVLDKQVDAASDDQERIGALLRLGELVEQRFLKPRDAAPKFELALELDPENLRALNGLERCWHALREWENLAAVLERRAAGALLPREAISALERLAEVREAKQESLEMALAAWRRVYELDTSHLRAIHELARLCEKQGDVTAAAAYRARLADLTDDAREKARIHVSVGEMLAPEGRDPACARIHFERAVEMDPRNASAWEHLQQLAVRERDMMYATFCLERRAEHTDSPRLKAQLLIELAKMRLSLGDARGALATFEYAFETDATNETAARAVLEEWTKREKWTDAQRACDVLVAGATRDGDGNNLIKLLRLSTRIALALGNGDRALMAAAAARDLAPQDAGAREDVLHVCHELRDRPELRDRLSSIVEGIVREAMDLSPGTLVQLGEVRLATGDRHGGVELLCLALAQDAENRAALTTLSRAFHERRDWARAANCKHRLARVSPETEQKPLFLEAAEIWEKRARAPSRAVMVLEEALERDPRDPVVLARLVALWGSLGEWEKLVVGLRCLGNLEKEGPGRAKHLYASAGVVREKVGDLRRAARLYEEVLDLDPSRLDAFERVVRAWTDLRDWQELELSYRRMIARVPEGAEKKLAHALYHQLGLVYRDRIGEMPRALDAFRRAARLAPPEEDEDRRIIVELLVLTGQSEVAVAEMRRTLATDATRPATHRELYDLFLRDGAHDKAWCAANALVHLGAADQQQAKFSADFPPVDLGAVPGTLAPCAWTSHVMSPDIDERLTAVFRYLVPAVVRARMTRVPEKSRMRWLGAQVREEDSPLAARIVTIVRNGAEILGVPAPLLLARPKLPVPFAVAPTPAPALFVSLPSAEAVPPELLPFLVARRMAELRPELVAHALFPTLSELKTLLKTALRVAVATPASPPQHPDEAAIARALEPFEMEGMREAVSAIIGTEAQADIRRWLQLADLSISRAALLLVGDFDLAWRAMQREPRSPSDLSPGDWRNEMLAFLVSDEHADLREAIGVNVEARS